MTLPQPGQVRKVDTNITLSSSNDVYLTPTVSGSRFMYNGSQFVLLEYDTNTNRMEANVWSNNGTEVANFYFSKKYLLDANFDKSDDVYYGLRWNNETNYRGGGFTFPVQSEGGTESAVGLLVDDFDSNKVWHVDGIEYLRLEHVEAYDPPTITVSREKKRWTTYSGSEFLGSFLDSYADQDVEELYYGITSISGGATYTDFVATTPVYGSRKFRVPFPIGDNSWLNEWVAALYIESPYQESIPIFECGLYVSVLEEDRHLYTTPLYYGLSNRIEQYPEERSTNLFQVEPGSSKLAYYSNAGLAYLDFDVEINGDFLAYLDLDIDTFLGDSVFSFRALRRPNNSSLPYNHLSSIVFRGPYGAGGERLECWGVEYRNDTSSSAWDVCNLRLNERWLPVNGGIVSPETSKVFKVVVDQYEFEEYQCGSNDCQYHTLRFKVAGEAGVNYGRGVASSKVGPNTYNGGIGYRGYDSSFSWVGDQGRLLCFDFKTGYIWDETTGTAIDPVIDDRVVGTSRDIAISMFRETSPPMNNLRLAIKRVGTTIYYLKRDRTIPDGPYTLIQSYDLGYAGPVRFELYADGTAGASSPNISADKFVVRGLLPSESGGSTAPASSSWPHPVFTVELFDLDGNPKYAAGRSDAGGNVISRLDIIKAGIDKGGDFADFFNQSQIATNHEATVSGEVYINIKRDFYKYAKADLPLNDTVESGTVAELIVGGALFGDPKYNTLNWNGYTQAGLYYISGNTADPGSGRYLNCIRSTTMSGNNPVKFAWLEQAGTYNDFYAADVNQPYLLYGLSDSDRKVYMYNLNEDSSAFCNVVSNKQIMGANTGDVSTVTAQVLNVYGDPLEGKTVLFEISSGDGSVSPGSDVTDALGEATTTYTVGATVGTAQIEATVTN